jgi:hypothetical protein
VTVHFRTTLQGAAALLAGVGLAAALGGEAAAEKAKPPPASAAPAAKAKPAERDKDKDAKHAEAVAHFEKGKKLGEVGRYEESIKEFEEAYLAEPIAEILLNIALSHRFLKNYDKAIEFYDRYLKLKPDAPNRKEIEGRIKELMKDKAAAAKADDAAHKGGDPKGPARLVVNSDPPGARVRAGAKEMGTTPLVAEVEPGGIVLHLELKGFEPKDVGVVAEAGRDAIVSAALVPIGKKDPGIAPLPGGGAGDLEVTTNLPGAEIVVDGVVVARAPMERHVAIPAGRHRLVARAPDFDSAPNDLIIEAGKLAKPELVLMPHNEEATGLFLNKTDKFLASGLTIEGYWRKRKGTAELTWGFVMFGLGSSGLTWAAIVLRGAYKDCVTDPVTMACIGGQLTDAESRAVAAAWPTVFVVAGPLTIIGAVFLLTGAVKLASVKNHRWVRPGMGAGDAGAPASGPATAPTKTSFELLPPVPPGPGGVTILAW